MKRFEGKTIDRSFEYALIGEYVSTFELLVFQIRLFNTHIFQMRGLSDISLIEIVFGQKMFTAEPLVTCFESLCNELLKDKKESIKILQRVNSFKCQFSKQISFRNDICHGTSFMGKHIVEITDKEHPKDILIIKNSPTKQGHRIKEVINSSNDLQKNIDELNELYSEFGEIRSEIVIFVNNNNMLVGFGEDKRK